MLLCDYVQRHRQIVTITLSSSSPMLASSVTTEEGKVYLRLGIVTKGRLRRLRRAVGVRTH